MRLAILFSACLLATAAARTTAAEPQFAEVDALLAGAEGHHTFRVPSLAVDRSGAVLLFCDGRVNGSGDLGKVNLVMKRSVDGGRTWQPLVVLATDPGPKTKIGNVSAVADLRAGAVHAVYCRNLAQAFCLTTTDGGATFAPAVEITATFKQFAPPWKFFATGHAHGIQLDGGRLVVPVFLSEVPRTGGGKRDKFHAGIIYSDDRGRSWRPGGLVPEGDLLNENSVYQCANGSLVLNARSKGVGRRVIARSDDAGMTWSPPAVEDALYDCTCQASTLVVRDGKGKRVLLFSNPAGPGRKNLSVRISRDDGRTWPLAVLIDDNLSAYSDLAAGSDGAIYLAYENGKEYTYKKITVARFNLDWLFEHARTVEAPSGDPPQGKSHQ